MQTVLKKVSKYFTPYVFNERYVQKTKNTF